MKLALGLPESGGRRCRVRGSLVRSGILGPRCDAQPEDKDPDSEYEVEVGGAIRESMGRDAAPRFVTPDPILQRIHHHRHHAATQPPTAPAKAKNPARERGQVHAIGNEQGPRRDGVHLAASVAQRNPRGHPTLRVRPNRHRSAGWLCDADCLHRDPHAGQGTMAWVRSESREGRSGYYSFGLALGTRPFRTAQRGW